MSDGFDTGWAEETVRQLAGVGVVFRPGMDDARVAAIAAAFGIDAVPQELELFLRAGVPVSPRWAPWADGAERVAELAHQRIGQGVVFDVEHGQHWHPAFGDRPADDRAAIQQALAVIGAAPALLPIYAHRFLTTAPTDGPRAVLSVWQPTDSIVFGNDLADYFAREFGIPRPEWARTEAPLVPVWDELLDLFPFEEEPYDPDDLGLDGF
jgi:hypothetical protein